MRQRPPTHADVGQSDAAKKSEGGMDGTGAARSPVVSQVNLMMTGDTLATAPLLRHTSGREWAYAGDARTVHDHTATLIATGGSTR